MDVEFVLANRIRKIVNQKSDCTVVSAMPEVTKKLTDSEPSIRNEAAWAMAQIGPRVSEMVLRSTSSCLQNPKQWLMEYAEQTVGIISHFEKTNTGNQEIVRQIISVIHGWQEKEAKKAAILLLRYILAGKSPDVSPLYDVSDLREIVNGVKGELFEALSGPHASDYASDEAITDLVRQSTIKEKEQRWKRWFATLREEMSKATVKNQMQALEEQSKTLENQMQALEEQSKTLENQIQALEKRTKTLEISDAAKKLLEEMWSEWTEHVPEADEASILEETWSDAAKGLLEGPLEEAESKAKSEWTEQVPEADEASRQRKIEAEEIQSVLRQRRIEERKRQIDERKRQIEEQKRQIEGQKRQIEGQKRAAEEQQQRQEIEQEKKQAIERQQRVREENKRAPDEEKWREAKRKPSWKARSQKSWKSTRKS